MHVNNAPLKIPGGISLLFPADSKWHICCSRFNIVFEYYSWQEVRHGVLHIQKLQFHIITLFLAYIPHSFPGNIFSADFLGF